MALSPSVSSTTAAAAATMVTNLPAYTQDGFIQYYDSFANSQEQFVTPVQIEKTLLGETGDIEEGSGLQFGHPGPPQPRGGGAGCCGGGGLKMQGMFGGEARQFAPTSVELSPYFGRLFADDGSYLATYNDFKIVVHEKDDDIPVFDLNLRKTGTRDKIKKVRTMASLRAPIVVSGWGFGMDAMPVPRMGNTYQDSGFANETSGGNVQFDPRLMHDRGYWKTGPLDIRWDDERQVWSTGPEIICGVATSSITPGTPCNPSVFEVSVLRRLVDVNTGKMSNRLGETIIVHNRDPSLEQAFQANAIFVIAIRLNYEFLPLWVGCPEQPCYLDPTSEGDMAGTPGTTCTEEGTAPPPCLSSPGEL